MKKRKTARGTAQQQQQDARQHLKSPHRHARARGTHTHTHLDEGIGLGETLETLDQLGQVLGVLALDGDAHDGGHGVLHHAEVVGALVRGDGTRLHEELIDTDQTDNVAGGHVLNGLDEATHHEHGALCVGGGKKGVRDWGEQTGSVEKSRRIEASLSFERTQVESAGGGGGGFVTKNAQAVKSGKGDPPKREK